MIPDVMVDLIFIVILLRSFYSAYRAGWKDGRRWEAMHKQCKNYNGPIPMGRLQRRDTHDL